MATLVYVFTQSEPVTAGRTNIATRRSTTTTTARTPTPRSTWNDHRCSRPTCSSVAAEVVLTADAPLLGRPRHRDDARARQPEQGDDREHERRGRAVLGHPAERRQDPLDEPDHEASSERC